MSRARKANRDARKLLGETIMSPSEEKSVEPQDKPVAKKQQVYNFTIDTPAGRGNVSIPHDQVKVCPCGSDLFRLLYRVIYVKPPGAVGVEPQQLIVQVFVCDSCNREVSPNDKIKAQLQPEKPKLIGV